MTPAQRAILLAPFNPLRVFRGGAQGLYLAPWNLASMFQDASMAQPVTAAGQTVAKMLDLSGNGNTVTFTDATLEIDSTGRPYVAFNGTSTFGLTSAINFTAADKMTVIAGVSADIADAAIRMIVNLNGTGFNAFSLQAPNSSAGAVSAVASGASGSAAASKTGLSSPMLATLTLQADIAANTTTLRVNGVVAQTATSAMGGGTFANAAVGIGRQSNSAQRYLKGNLYGLLVCGADVNSTAIAKTERFLAGKAGSQV